MLLALDIGNTNITVGLFQSDKLKATWRISPNVHKTSDEYASIFMNLFASRDLSMLDVNHAIIASVVPPLTGVFQQVCQHYFKVEPLIVAAGVKTGVRICIDNPREVGADRIVNTHAAYRLYGGPVIVIDFSTATIFDIVSGEGDYLGGVIAPGIGISAEALFTHAAKLPLVELIAPKNAIGKNTIAAMQSGLIFGYVGLVEGIVCRLQKELDNKARVIGTGGLAEVIARETKIIEKVDQQITLVGLRMIHELNRRDRW